MRSAEPVTGIFAVYAFDEMWRVAKVVYYGIMALNHRGQAGCGMCLFSGRGLSLLESNIGYVDVAFNVEELVGREGWIGLGWVYSTVGRVAKRVHIGSKECICVFYVNLPERDLEKISKVLPELKRDLDEGVEKLNVLSREIQRPISFVLLTEDGELYVYRDPSGLKPLHVGAYGFDLGIISTEPCAIECIGGDPRADMPPGSAMCFTKYLVERSRVQDLHRRKYCALEYIYYSRLDSTIDEIPVYDFRRTLSRIVSRRAPLSVDVVIGVPETGVVYAVEIAKHIGRDFSFGFVQTGRRIRSALVQDYLERLIGVQLKMSPIRCVMQGRSILLVDDSLLKGITLRNIIQYIRNRVGVREVHVLVASPPIRYECPFGMDIPPREELLCANVSLEDLPRVLDADSVTFATLDDLYEAFEKFNVDKDQVCTYCMTGRLPTW